MKIIKENNIMLNIILIKILFYIVIIYSYQMKEAKYIKKASDTCYFKKIIKLKSLYLY
jgi:hypothetical protein